MRNSPLEKEGVYSPALTGLRGVAAALVFAHHFFGQLVGGSGAIAELLREGYIGVSMFFTLSGYLITRRYFDFAAFGSLSFGDYFVRRMARIYPLYFALLLAHYAIRYFQLTLYSQVAANFTLTQAFFGQLVFTGISVAWTLSVELTFYLLAPFLFVMLGRCFGGTRKVRGAGSMPWEGVKWLLPLSGAAALLWLTGLGIGKLGTDFHSYSPENLMLYSLFGRFPEFALGIFAALWNPGVSARKAWVGELFAGGAVALVLLGMRCLGAIAGPHGIGYGISAPSGGVALWLPSAGTLLFIWAVECRSRIASIALGNRTAEYLGKISYATYLLQGFALFHDILWPYFRKEIPSLHVSFVGSYGVILVLAALLYEGIEKPAHAFVVRRFSRHLPRRRTPNIKRRARRYEAGTRGAA